MISNLQTDTKTKVMDLNKKNISNYILITILISTLIYYFNLQFCFFISTFLSGAVYRADIINNFQFYEDDYYFYTLWLSYLFSTLTMIFVYTQFIVNAKKVLEFYLTNLLIFYLFLILKNGRFICWRLNYMCLL